MWKDLQIYFIIVVWSPSPVWLCNPMDCGTPDSSVLHSLLEFAHIHALWWHPTPVLLPGKSHGWRSLEGCSPWGHWGWDTTKRLHFHFSLSGIGEGNGNPLQCSCLENPRDGGAWWAAVHGVAQSRTQLKQLSSSSMYMSIFILKLTFSFNGHW